METLVVTVDTKKNVNFLKKLLLKFNFVIDIKSRSSDRKPKAIINVAGKLHAYADPSKQKQEKFAWEKIARDKHGNF